jgi:hypothetical protein
VCLKHSGACSDRDWGSEREVVLHQIAGSWGGRMDAEDETGCKGSVTEIESEVSTDVEKEANSLVNLV